MADQSRHLEEELRAALEECARLREENERLRKQLGRQDVKACAHPVTDHVIAYENTAACDSPSVTNASNQKMKIALFRSLFRGRVDVYPVRWEDKKGRSGYAPACAHERTPLLF